MGMGIMPLNSPSGSTLQCGAGKVCSIWQHFLRVALYTLLCWLTVNVKRFSHSFQGVIISIQERVQNFTGTISRLKSSLGKRCPNRLKCYNWCLLVDCRTYAAVYPKSEILVLRYSVLFCLKLFIKLNCIRYRLNRVSALHVAAISHGWCRLVRAGKSGYLNFSWIRSRAYGCLLLYVWRNNRNVPATITTVNVFRVRFEPVGISI